MDEKGEAYVQETRGTSLFRAPETISKNYINENADLWAFGMILYHMAVGYPPKNI